MAGWVDGGMGGRRVRYGRMGGRRGEGWADREAESEDKGGV